MEKDCVESQGPQRNIVLEKKEEKRRRMKSRQIKSLRLRPCFHTKRKPAPHLVGSWQSRILEEILSFHCCYVYKCFNARFIVAGAPLLMEATIDCFIVQLI